MSSVAPRSEYECSGAQKDGWDGDDDGDSNGKDHDSAPADWIFRRACAAGVDAMADPLMPPIFDVETAVVGRRADGELVIAIMQSLPPPLDKTRTCVVLLQCTQAAAEALCASIARTR